MNRWTVWLLIAFAAAAGIGGIVGGRENGEFFLKLVRLLFLAWLAWRALLLIRRHFRPASKVIMPATDEALRSVGFGKIVETGRRANRKLDNTTGVDPDKNRLT